MTEAQVFQGKPCDRCGSTHRYRTGQCAACHRKRLKDPKKNRTGKTVSQNSLHARGLVPEAPSREKWPTFQAADRTTIHQDPIMVMAMRGEHKPGKFE